MTNPSLALQAFESIKNVLADIPKPIALHEPWIKGQEWNYVKSCLDSGWVSYLGEYVQRFENDLAKYTGVKSAIAVSSGTAALHVCCLLAGVLPGDEVLLPSLSFVATANAVTYCGGIPHFVDVNETTLGVDPENLRNHLAKSTVAIKGGGRRNKVSGNRIVALIVMHTFGQPSDLEQLESVCSEFGLTMIEDAAESLGTFYKGKHTGNWGKISALSFNGNKVVTTGGGGAIITNDVELAKKAKHLTTTAKVPHKWELKHDAIGFNYRLANVNAAIGCAQLEAIEEFITLKRELTSKYLQALHGISGLKVFQEVAGARSNYWLNAVIFDSANAKELPHLLKLLHDDGILARPSWIPLHQLVMYSSSPRMDLTTTESLALRIVNLPSSPQLLRKRS